MSKEINEVENVEVVQEAVDNSEQVSHPISIQIVDILDALNIIEVAIERSAFKAQELVSIMPVYQKLKSFAEEVQKADSKGA